MEQGIANLIYFVPRVKSFISGRKPNKNFHGGCDITTYVCAFVYTLPLFGFLNASNNIGPDTCIKEQAHTRASDTWKKLSDACDRCSITLGSVVESIALKTV